MGLDGLLLLYLPLETTRLGDSNLCFYGLTSAFLLCCTCLPDVGGYTTVI